MKNSHHCMLDLQTLELLVCQVQVYKTHTTFHLLQSILRYFIVTSKGRRQRYLPFSYPEPDMAGCTSIPRTLCLLDSSGTESCRAALLQFLIVSYLCITFPSESESPSVWSQPLASVGTSPPPLHPSHSALSHGHF